MELPPASFTPDWKTSPDQCAVMEKEADEKKNQR
jgi:hypothetical protein